MRKQAWRGTARTILRGGGLLACMPILSAAPVVAQSGATVPGAPAGATQRCAALAGLAQKNLVFRSTELIPAGPALGPDGKPGPGAAALPEHCRVQAVINPRTGHGGKSFGITFELRMPVDWNGRFVFQGGGGLDGQLLPALGNVTNSAKPGALARGFAVVSTDSGHQGPLIDASFGLDQQARIDYGYNALDKVTSRAKQLIASFYGKPAEFSYFLGCSNGGRQALTASQRLPLEFDGIVAGDPAIGFSRLAIDQVWNQTVVHRHAPRNAAGEPIYARLFSDDDLKLVRSELLGRCDAMDGLADGMINDWQRCDFKPAMLACKGEKTASCLGANQVAALEALHTGPRTSSGGIVYGPFNYDTGIASSAWRGIRLGTSQNGTPNAGDGSLGLGQLRLFQMTPPDPDFDPHGGFDVDEVMARVRSTAALADADSPFLETFVRRAKMITYNGLSDQGMASSVLVDWYRRMLSASGPGAQDAVRLFLVPGMLHCGGGEATDQFEMLDAIQAWVEEGKAPERIVATGKSMPGISRPLCPFPKVARYKGGDPSKAESFACES